MAVDAHVRYLRGGRRRNAVAAAGWLLIALAASDKGVVVPLLLFGLTAAFFTPGRWPAAVVRAAVRYWRLWLVYVILMAAWGAVYVTHLSGSAVKPDSASDVLNFVSTFTGTNLLPAVFGGPWRWSTTGYNIVNPPAALQQLSWAVAIVVVVVSCARRVRAWRAWALLAAWIVAADIVPIVLGRLGGISTSLVAVQARYLMDATPVLALCIGLAFLPVAGPSMAEPDVIRFRLPAARSAVLVTMSFFLVGSFWSLQAFESLNSAAATAARYYIATARVAVADAPRGTMIVDGPTPASVMDPGIFGLYGNTSFVIGAIARSDAGQAPVVDRIAAWRGRQPDDLQRPGPAAADGHARTLLRAAAPGAELLERDQHGHADPVDRPAVPVGVDRAGGLLGLVLGPGVPVRRELDRSGAPRGDSYRLYPGHG